MMTFYELADLSIDAHADAIIKEFGIDALASDVTSQQDAQKNIRNRLIDHLDAAQERGKNIRESFLVE